MSTTVKILLGIAAFFVLCGTIVAWKAYSWWQTDGKVFVDAMRTSQEEGRVFGKTTDNAGCVKSGFDRFGDDTSRIGVLRATAFMSMCLPESKPTPGFCDGVPEPTEFSAARDWNHKKCATVQANERACRLIMGPVPGYCHPRDKRAA